MYKTSLIKALVNEGNNRSTAITDKVLDKTIDTCYTPDTGAWETGIQFEGHWSIVEHYANEEEAREKHKVYVKKCEDKNYIPEDCSDIEYGF